MATESLAKDSAFIAPEEFSAHCLLHEVRRWCDDVVCLLQPEMFWAIGQFYEDFSQVEDEEVVRLLHEFAPAARRREQAEKLAEVPAGLAGLAGKGPEASG